MPFCENCGGNTGKKDHFCPYCGNKLDQAADSNASARTTAIDDQSLAPTPGNNLSGIEEAKVYLNRIKTDHHFSMKVQKCINQEELFQLLEEEGYSFTEEDLKNALSQLEEYSSQEITGGEWFGIVLCTPYGLVKFFTWKDSHPKKANKVCVFYLIAYPVAILIRILLDAGC